MPRASLLKPAYRPERAKKNLSAWCVNVPPYLSDKPGRRRQLFFETREEARTVCEQYKARKANFGLSLNSLSPARLSEAAECHALLQPFGGKLLTVVQAYVQNERQRRASITFLQLFNLYLESKQHRSPQYLRELRITRDRWPELHSKLVSDITHEDLEKIFKGLSPAARNAAMRYLKAVFFLGIKRGFLSQNPIARLDFVERKRKEIQTIPNERVAAVLNHALYNDLNLLPFLVFAFFSGIRPRGELQKLECSDVKLAEGEIVIRPEVSKTNRRRFPKISQNALEWIEAYRQRGGTLTAEFANSRPASS